MIHRCIHWSLHNSSLVILVSVVLCLLGWRAIQNTPIDAIPDLSDVQVIVKTSYPGQAPKVIEDQVTRPLSSALLAVPGAHTVRGFSFFGDSYVYVIFDEKTDHFWARSRVLEYLSQAANNLPTGVKPQLGPAASGVGWIFIYALHDTTGQHNISELRSLQDWFLRFELQALEGVAEVAAIGGMVKQYQVVVDPAKLLAHDISLEQLKIAIERNNKESSASVIELGEAEYMLRATGYIKSLQELKETPVQLASKGPPITLDQIANVVETSQMRRGVADLNGSGESVGGVIVMRDGGNAQETIAAVKNKLAELTKALPEGVEILPVYDRSNLILRAVENLWYKVFEELVLVGLVLLLFLLCIRSVFVAMVTLPIGILCSFIIMKWQGVNANIMSLGGIAIAIGAMVDGAIVMIENLHRHRLESSSTAKSHWQLVYQSSKEVGPTLFFSLLIITVSFLPVFTLEAEEGRLFKPLALTKTYAMAAAAILSITLIPALLFSVLKTTSLSAGNAPLQKALLAMYQPLLIFCLDHRKAVLLGSIAICSLILLPLQGMKSEFMPPLDEGDLMYMPTTHPGISIGRARELLRQTDEIIRTVPEVQNVFGKVGRADTATDPAPLTMIETFIQLKPKSTWRSGVTTASLIAELENKVRFPGLTNAWVMPIKTRIDMLSTGMKTALGIKLAGDDFTILQSLGEEIEALLSQHPSTLSVYTERSAGGRYLNIDINKTAAAQYGIDTTYVQNWLQMAVGGMPFSQTVEGGERYSISLRFPDDYRNSLQKLQTLPLQTPNGARLQLKDVADLSIQLGPPMFKSENGRLNTWIYLDIGEADIQTFVAEAEKQLEALSWPQGYSMRWAGQYESIARVNERLQFIVPLTLISIAILLYLNFHRFDDVFLLMGTLPFALVGGLLLMWVLDYKFSVAVAVGFIALAGLAVETGAIMLQVLRGGSEHETLPQETVPRKSTEQLQAPDIVARASLRVRPVIMTATATIAGLLPMMVGSEPGSEVMSRIAAPIIGGLFTCVLLTLFVLPTFYFWLNNKMNQTT